MKRNDIQSLKQKTADELRGLLKDAQDKLRGLRFDLNAGKVQNVKEVHSTKRYIARVLTFIKQSHA